MVPGAVVKGPLVSIVGTEIQSAPNPLVRGCERMGPRDNLGSREHANRIFLIPAYRVHYVVSDEIERLRDRRS
jgi:hypothetical protein